MKRNEVYLFVDGYNIINAWGELKSLSEIDLELARERLIEIMAEYKAYTGYTIIIVFDAHLVKGSNEKKFKVYDIEVVFTKEKETADAYIEKVLDNIGKRKKVIVATSDWVEQQIILGRGGTRVSARELKIEIDDIKNTIKRKTKKNIQKNKNSDLFGRLDSKTLQKLENLRRKS